VESGESDGGLLENAAPQVNALIDAHETWAKRTLMVSLFAAFAAGGSVLTERWPRIARVVAIVAAAASVAAAYGVYETGHRGGAMVYRHGAGVEIAGTVQSTAADAVKRTVTDPDTD
jgi:hypothetical protein